MLDSSTMTRTAGSAALLDFSSELLGTLDFDGRVLAANRAWEEAFARPAAELAGVRFVDLLHPQDAPRALAALQGAVRDGRGAAFDARATASGGGLLISWRLSCVAAAGALLVAGAAADPDEGLVGLGLAAEAVAHDLNNHLGVVLGGTMLLRALFAPESAPAKDAAALDAAARRACEDVRRLFAFAPCDRPAPGEVNTALADMRWFLSRLTHSKTLELALCADVCGTRVDAADLRRALLALALVARGAAPGGFPARIETRREAAAAPSALDAEDRVVVSLRGPRVRPDPFRLHAARRAVARCGGTLELLDDALGLELRALLPAAPLAPTSPRVP